MQKHWSLTEPLILRESIPMKMEIPNSTTTKWIIIGKIIFNCIGMNKLRIIGIPIWHFILLREEVFFEQYKENDDFSTYGIEPIMVDGEEVDKTDLIRRRWLDNDFYGTTFSVNYDQERLNLILGGGWNKYEGSHFGEIIWARYSNNKDYEDRYYDNSSTKTDLNLFAKANYKFSDQWSAYGDLQYRTIGYTANGEDTGIVDDTFNFFNPKVGITFDLNMNNNFYLSYARANREPNRNDYESGSPKPEKLNRL